MRLEIQQFCEFANAQIGHNVPMIKPKESDTLDFEAELQ